VRPGAPHQGSIKMTGAASLAVNGSRVLTTAGVSGTAVKDCANPGNAGGACTKVTSMTGGASTCLRVDGDFVVLDSLQATTDKQSAVTVEPHSISNDLLRAD
jgi:hypothetical protein